MAELADAADSKSAGLRPLGVRFPLPAPALNSPQSTRWILVERSPAGLGVGDFIVGGVRVLDTGSKFRPSRDSKVDAFTYNLAIVEERMGKRDEALQLLREAVDHGLSAGFRAGMQKDPDLKSLHGDPRFVALIAETKSRAATASQ